MADSRREQLNTEFPRILADASGCDSWRPRLSERYSGSLQDAVVFASGTSVGRLTPGTAFSARHTEYSSLSESGRIVDSDREFTLLSSVIHNHSDWVLRGGEGNEGAMPTLPERLYHRAGSER